MYSPPIGNTIKQAPPRRTEEGDTRQEILRHDPDQNPKKNKKKEKEEIDPFNADDNAFVTIEALAAFLENFLRNLVKETAATTKQSADVKPPTTTKNEKTHPPPQQNRQAAAAANAYQTRASTTDKKDINFDSDVADIPETGLNANEIRDVHRLLNNLQILSKRNIQTLEIERSDSFLQSLTTAVNNAVARSS